MHPDVFVPAWHAVYTKPRQERRALEHLQRQGFDSFLPLAFNPRKLLPGERPRVEPMFPRYLFVHRHNPEQNLAVVRSTRGVCCMVRFGSRLAEVPGWLVHRLRAASDGDGLVQLEALTLGAGDRVQIYDGPLAGLEGIVAAIHGDQRVSVLLEIMGRQQTIKIAPEALRSPR